MTDANVIDGDSSPTGDAGMPFVIMQPHLGSEPGDVGWRRRTSILIRFRWRCSNQNPSAIMHAESAAHVPRVSWLLRGTRCLCPTSGNELAVLWWARWLPPLVGLRPPIVQYFPPELESNEYRARRTCCVRLATLQLLSSMTRCTSSWKFTKS